MSADHSGEQSVRRLIHHWSGVRQVTARGLEGSQVSQRPMFYYTTRFRNAVLQAAVGWDGVSVTR